MWSVASAPTYRLLFHGNGPATGAGRLAIQPVRRILAGRLARWDGHVLNWMNRRMEPFARRIYRSPIALARDAARLLSKTGQVGRLMRGESLDSAFRERLMLTVTVVNGCRHCSHEHARQALVAGVSAGEIEALAGGTIDDCPPAELRALLYAQHWAESDGKPDPEARKRLFELYGEEVSQAIDLALGVIRMGNLGGNTIDHILFRLSFGRLGVDARSRHCVSA